MASSRGGGGAAAPRAPPRRPRRRAPTPPPPPSPSAPPPPPRHFAADGPPPALVNRRASRFLDTDGDLKEVARALVAAPEAWAPERTKIKRPAEWITAGLRAIGRSGDI